MKFTHTLITRRSNIRLIDCINKPKALIDYAISQGLKGISITDHECLSAAMEVNMYAKELQEKYPDFKIALGNEIYLVDERKPGIKYYHCILIAKDAIGHKQLRELSSIAWMNSYSDRGLERVPTLKSDLKRIIKSDPGHVIATSACIGGELSANTLIMAQARSKQDKETEKTAYKSIVAFMKYMIDIFKNDFYVECAPGTSEEQILVNKNLVNIARAFNCKMVIGTDAHYLTKDQRFVHKSYLNSKEGEREVDDFYEFSYLQTAEELQEHLSMSNLDYDVLCDNSMEIYDKITFYSLQKHQSIPEVEVKDYPKKDVKKEYTVLNSLYQSDNAQERYWINQCEEALIQKGLNNDKRYWERLEEEASVKRTIGEKLQTCMFAYPNTLQHYIDLFWRCGSTVGAGRGSACSGLNHYLLGITQLDPIKWDLPFWRYLNNERVELGDIDLDLAPSKLQDIFKEIRKERGEYGLVQVATFGTEGTKSAVQTAFRGYRSEQYPNGIDVDEAQYLSSLIPVERGFLWSLHDVVYGNEELDRKPITQFIHEVNKYPGLLDIMMGIEGIISRRGSHASGVILFDENIYDNAALMKTPSGAIITQWDLHMQEAAGSVKYDFLLTSVQDIIIQTIKLLQADGELEKDLSLREIYNKYLHPEVLPLEDKRIWDALAKGSVINCFQFDSAVGSQAAKKIKPKNPIEMSDANGLMRLMTAEKGAETPLDKYVKFKNNIQLWYKEMDKAGLTKVEQKTLEPYFLSSYGVPPSQEQLMRMLMDENICGFTLKEANSARKIVGKKQMNKIPELHEQVLARAKTSALGKYVWECGIGPQMGYSFSTIHSLAYSFVGIQTLYLATNFNPIYWNTACLIVDSGSLETDGDVKRAASTDYTKVAKAIGKMRKSGIEVSLVNINKSDFGFKPDIGNNRILFGLKSMLNVGDDLVIDIINNRPYTSPEDFVDKVNPNRQAMVALIKGGGFDEFQDRTECMKWYIRSSCDQKKRITMQNLAGLMEHKLIPEDYKEEKRVYEFTRYLKKVCRNTKENYYLDERAINFLTDINQESLIEQNNNEFILKKTEWDTVYSSYLDILRQYITANKDILLKKLNDELFKEDWNKYAQGSISAWEMEVLCFYYHEHELTNANVSKYGIVDFFSLPEEPEVETSFKLKNGAIINRLKLYKIAGTVIAKNKVRSTVSLLTTTGVVDVKFRKEYFALFDKQISLKGSDGVKHVVEKSWFNRGNMLIVQGFRSADSFIPKKYSNSQGHQLYRIQHMTKNGNFTLQTERTKGIAEDE